LTYGSLCTDIDGVTPTKVAVRISTADTEMIPGVVHALQHFCGKPNTIYRFPQTRQRWYPASYMLFSISAGNQILFIDFHKRDRDGTRRRTYSSAFLMGNQILFIDFHKHYRDCTLTQNALQHFCGRLNTIYRFRLTIFHKRHRGGTRLDICFSEFCGKPNANQIAFGA